MEKRKENPDLVIRDNKIVPKRGGEGQGTGRGGGGREILTKEGRSF